MEATLSCFISKKIFFSKSVDKSLNIKLEGLYFLYSPSFMTKHSWLFDYFYAIWVNFKGFFTQGIAGITQGILKTCEISWTCYNLTSFPISIQYTVKKYQHQLSQKKMYPCTHCVHLRFISSLAKRDWTSRSTANIGAHIVQPRCCQVNATNMARNI